jgi:endonuclease YncB( thermonuclease family)
MSNIRRTLKPPENRRQFVGYVPRNPYLPDSLGRRRKRFWMSPFKLAVLAMSTLMLLGLAGMKFFGGDPLQGSFECADAQVIDGATLGCGNRRVRLRGIDPPGGAADCRPGQRCASGDAYASRENLRKLAEHATLQCRQDGVDDQGRIVARCTAGNRDLSCAQVNSGNAIERYGFLAC